MEVLRQKIEKLLNKKEITLKKNKKKVNPIKEKAIGRNIITNSSQTGVHKTKRKNENERERLKKEKKRVRCRFLPSFVSVCCLLCV